MGVRQVRLDVNFTPQLDFQFVSAQLFLAQGFDGADEPGLFFTRHEDLPELTFPQFFPNVKVAEVPRRWFLWVAVWGVVVFGFAGWGGGGGGGGGAAAVAAEAAVAAVVAAGGGKDTIHCTVWRVYILWQRHVTGCIGWTTVDSRLTVQVTEVQFIISKLMQTFR